MAECPFPRPTPPMVGPAGMAAKVATTGHSGSQAPMPALDVGACSIAKSSMCVTQRALIQEPIQRQQHLVLILTFGLA